jgi:RimJ/RimL family protein N-acetyltransferase
MTVRLRRVTEADLPVLFEQMGEPASTAMAGLPARDEPAFYEHWRKIMADPEVVLRAIVLERDAVAGHVVSFERQPGRREVGYWVAREHWGKGLASDALGQLLDIEHRRPLYAHVLTANKGSLRVLEKCGFEPLPDAEAFSSGYDDTADEVTLVLRT